jgi:PAS domain S-box-containing protein
MENKNTVNEYRIIKKNGEIIRVRISSTPRLEKGSFRGLRGILSDVTEKHRFEKSLLESEARFHAIFDNALDGILLVDPETFGFSLANESICKMLGYRCDEITRLGVKDIHPEAEREKVFETFSKMANRELDSARDVPVVRRDGGVFYADISGSYVQIDGRDNILCIFRDVSERRWTESFLGIQHDLGLGLLSASNLRDAFYHMLNTVLQFDEIDCGGIYQVLENGDLKLIAHIGLSEEFVNFVSQIKADDPNIKKLMKGTALYGKYESIIFRPDDVRLREGLLALSSIPIVSNGRTIAVMNQASRKVDKFSAATRMALETIAAQVGGAIARIISADELCESEDRYGKLVEFLPEGVMVFAGGVLRFVNSSGLRILGADVRSYLNGKSLGDIFGAIDECKLRIMAESGLGQGYKHRQEIIRLDGSSGVIDFSAIKISYEGKDSILVMFRDAGEMIRQEEERRKIEEQMRHTQKLESLGVLAGGIAHDFNNLLTAILGHADLAMLETAVDSPMRDSLREIINGAKRAADLARQMLSYSGRGSIEMVPVDLGTIIREMAGILEVSISKKTRLIFDFENDLPAVEADPSQLRQVIMNLIVNASESLGMESGIISVKLGKMFCRTGYFDDAFMGHKMPEGEYVFIEVSDTGCGMDENTRQRMFDPFFTTKFTGRGLGLAAVLGIVKGHNGDIKVESSSGKGTKFRIYLPSSRNNPEHHAVEYHEPGAWQGNGTVLLVDDDEDIRLLGKRMLSRLGYNTLLAADGYEALSIFGKHAEKIACVILDLTMPIMDGDEALVEMRKISENIPAVISSGYSQNETRARIDEIGRVVFLQKPYQLKNLEESLRSLMG